MKPDNDDTFLDKETVEFLAKRLSEKNPETPEQFYKRISRKRVDV